MRKNRVNKKFIYLISPNRIKDNLFYYNLEQVLKTNLIKLTKKTHPADLGTVFRYFSDEEQLSIFSLMGESQHTAEFLSELDDALVNDLLNKDQKSVV